ncbi:uncharacterized protein LOC110818230 [Carica papaya]|uniref:uncharacterized protein LOC110818230 n=1 Tax=Carica papaya TaxID=3649 RepID=UPI000B8CECF7|nr:uncharacterized protein LOC110818230 [Carica papaya]
MVGVFRRSLSFPNKINPSRPSKPPISHHIRSISLPCRSHPLISLLKDHITQLKSWSSNKPQQPTSAWLCDGLTRLKDLHDSLHDLLDLPQTQDSLRNRNQWVETLLEDFLRLVDVYGIFQTSVLALKEEQSAAQVDIRRRDDSKVALYLKSRRKIAREMLNLVSTIRCISAKNYPDSVTAFIVSIGDAELAAVISDVVEATVMVSVALFNGIYGAFGWRKTSWRLVERLYSKKAKRVTAAEGIQELQLVGEESLWGLRKKGDEEVRIVLSKMLELEECIRGIENESERVMRSLITTRVSLLNILTNYIN